MVSGRGDWLAQWEVCATLDLGVVNSDPMLGVQITEKKNLNEKKKKLILEILRQMAIVLILAASFIISQMAGAVL